MFGYTITLIGLLVVIICVVTAVFVTGAILICAALNLLSEL